MLLHLLLVFPKTLASSVTKLIVVCVVLVVQVVAVLEGLKELGAWEQLVLAVLHLSCLIYAMFTNNILYIFDLSFLFSP